MTPELLKQIEARVKNWGPRSHAGDAVNDRAALLAYCRELEQSLDWAMKYQGYYMEECGQLWGELVADGDIPSHFAPILESSRKRINGSDKT